MGEIGAQGGDIENGEGRILQGRWRFEKNDPSDRRPEAVLQHFRNIAISLKLPQEPRMQRMERPSIEILNLPPKVEKSITALTLGLPEANNENEGTGRKAGCTEK